MIYLDATSACRSGLNTGVRRMQRFLHEHLRSREDYRPVVWQTILRRYCPISPEDLALLESQEHREPRGLARYDSFLPGLASDLIEVLRKKRERLGWPESLKSGDLILVPDLIWDNRASFFRRPLPPGVKKIGILHDVIPLVRSGQSAIDAALCAHEVRALAHFDGVICISGGVRDDLLTCWGRMGLKPVPTRVIPWPLPITGDRPESGEEGAKPMLLYVARLQKRKNHLALLRACKMLWDEGEVFRLQLIGCQSYPMDTARIVHEIRSLRQAGYDLEWRVHVSEKELRDAYRDASFTVYPSRAEGFGLPILESLWHGKPVLCCAEGVVEEAVTGGGCYVVDGSDAFSLAGGIRQLLDQSFRRVFSIQAREREFRSWVQYWSEFRDFIMDLENRAPRSDGSCYL
jgi:glycosyltransferase involved in cell wall biosynthesis